VASRLLHVYGTVTPSRWPKLIGAGVTYAVELALGGLLNTKMVQTLGH
jgi:hypothetical protein